MHIRCGEKLKKLFKDAKRCRSENKNFLKCVFLKDKNILNVQNNYMNGQRHSCKLSFWKFKGQLLLLIQLLFCLHIVRCSKRNKQILSKLRRIPNAAFGSGGGTYVLCVRRSAVGTRRIVLCWSTPTAQTRQDSSRRSATSRTSSRRSRPVSPLCLHHTAAHYKVGRINYDTERRHAIFLLAIKSWLMASRLNLPRGTRKAAKK